MKTLEIVNKRTLFFINVKKNNIKTKKVWDILKNLWLDVIWDWKSDLSVSHDNLLYK